MSAMHAWSLPAESAPAPLAGRGRLVLVAGGRQGVGVSTVAALFALVAGAEGEHVLLVDPADDGVAHRLFGAPRPGRSFGGLDALEPQPAPVLPDLAVLSLAGAEAGSLARRLATLRTRYPLVVVDGGSRLRTVLSAAAAGVDRLLCVTASDAISSAGAYAVLKALDSRVPGLAASVVVNRAPLWAAAEPDHPLRSAAALFLRRDIGPVGQVPLDECLRAGVRAGMALHEAAAGSPAALGLFEIARTVRPQPNPPSPPVFAPRTLQRRS